MRRKLGRQLLSAEFGRKRARLLLLVLVGIVDLGVKLSGNAFEGNDEPGGGLVNEGTGLDTRLGLLAFRGRVLRAAVLLSVRSRLPRRGLQPRARRARGHEPRQRRCCLLPSLAAQGISVSAKDSSVRPASASCCRRAAPQWPSTSALPTASAQVAPGRSSAATRRTEPGL